MIKLLIIVIAFIFSACGYASAQPEIVESAGGIIDTSESVSLPNHINNKKAVNRPKKTKHEMPLWEQNGPSSDPSGIDGR